MIRHVEIRSSQGMRTRGKYYLHFQTKSYIRLSLWSCCHSDVYGLVPQVADMLIASLADQVAMGAGSQVCPCHYSVIWFMACAGNVSPGFPPYVLGLSMSSRPTSRPPSWLVRSLCPFVGHPGPGHLCHIIQGASYSELMKFKS